MNEAALRAALQELVAALEYHQEQTRPITRTIFAIGRARAALSAPPSQEQEPPTEGYVQPVPDKCDRIVWRDRYYGLPLDEKERQDKELSFMTRGQIANLIDAAVAADRAARQADAVDARRLIDALNWALGAGGEFPTRKEGQGAYWWRMELQRRAGLKWNGEAFVADAAMQGEHHDSN